MRRDNRVDARGLVENRRRLEMEYKAEEDGFAELLQVKMNLMLRAFNIVVVVFCTARQGCITENL